MTTGHVSQSPVMALMICVSLSAPIPKYGNDSPERGARIARRDD